MCASTFRRRTHFRTALVGPMNVLICFQRPDWFSLVLFTVSIWSCSELQKLNYHCFALMPVLFYSWFRLHRILEKVLGKRAHSGFLLVCRSKFVYSQWILWGELSHCHLLYSRDESFNAAVKCLQSGLANPHSLGCCILRRHRSSKHVLCFLCYHMGLIVGRILCTCIDSTQTV